MQPPLEQVAIDGALAIVAGSDTSSCVMTNIVYYLMTHPDVYKRLQEEIARRHGYRIVSHRLEIYVEPLDRGRRSRRRG